MSTNGNYSSNECDHVTLDSNTVLISGAGPVGLLLSVVLASYGVKSVLLERNQSTTKWPKMDLTNARSMEMFRRLGLADGLRSKGVPSNIPSTVLISSGLSKPKAITAWLHPSVDEYRLKILETNDGTQPLEPYQRISQAIFEAWLKTICDENVLIDARFGWRLEYVDETDSGVISVATELSTGKTHTFKSSYTIGCDGASSQVRRSLKIPLDGGPVPGYVLLIHFKSRDLTRLQKQGQFWHIFFLGERGLSAAIIAQDEIDTWTVHLQLAPGADHESIDSLEAIYRCLGGLGESFKIEVDEILVRSTYRPSIAVARKYASSGGSLFLAGDAAHQNIPTGGYGMNMGLADAFDLGWKLAAVINGNGGPKLLASYEDDRRPVALMSIARSGVHMATHLNVADILSPEPSKVDDPSAEGQKIRNAIHSHYQANDGENTDLGVEMGYRYTSRICIPDEDDAAPEWVPSRYIPSTWPGIRAPHVFLRDGTPIYDRLGKGFTLVEFKGEDDQTSVDHSVEYLLAAAKELSVPLRHTRFVGELQASRLWERRLVIVRPDIHVAWRGNDALADYQAAECIIGVISGKMEPATLANGHNGAQEPVASFKLVMNETQDEEYHMEKMGGFQR